MATMKDIIQSPLLPALFGSMALGLFASSSSGSKVVKGGIKGVLPVLVIMTGYYDAWMPGIGRKECDLVA